MKASGILLIVVVLMSVAFTAGAAPGQDTSQWCEASRNWGTSHARCVSFVETFPAVVCNDLGNLGMENHTRCAMFLKDMVP